MLRSPPQFGDLFLQRLPGMIFPMILFSSILRQVVHYSVHTLYYTH